MNSMALGYSNKKQIKTKLYFCTAKIIILDDINNISHLMLQMLLEICVKLTSQDLKIKTSTM